VPAATATLDWRVALVRPGQLFEAFISHQSKSDADPHIRDAKLAIQKFLEGMRDPVSLFSAIEEPNCFNLLGAALLRTGYIEDT
jgi:hypothetical protein